MEKDFKKWHCEKERIHQKEDSPFFHEREIWWCSLGLNIGFEQDGKNENFERPVLVLRRFNRQVLWVLPLTSTDKSGNYYYQFEHQGRKSAIILTQLRLISSKRLLRKMGMLAEQDFEKVRKRIIELV